MGRRFTEDEINFVKEHYKYMPLLEIAKKLGRTRSSIMHTAQRRGFQRYHSKHVFWTEEEVKILKSNYATASRDELLKLIPRHSWSAITSKARQFDLKRTHYAIYKHLLKRYRLKVAEKGYLAGIIDGEGNISLIKAKKKRGFLLTPSIGVANSDPNIVELLKRKMRFSVFHQMPNVFAKGKLIPQRRKIYRLRIDGIAVLPLLEAITPYLVGKKEQAELLTHFCKIRLSKEWGEPYEKEEIQIHHRLKVLNSRRGKCYQKD